MSGEIVPILDNHATEALMVKASSRSADTCLQRAHIDIDLVARPETLDRVADVNI